MLVGSQDFIDQAKRWRKMLGGGMRQAGVLAAAGLVALDTMIDRLAEDHQHARRLAHGLANIDGLHVDPDSIQTNIVFFEVDEKLGTAADLIAALNRHGVLVSYPASSPSEWSRTAHSPRGHRGGTVSHLHGRPGTADSSVGDSTQMTEIDLDKERTALLIADFYEAMMTTIPHAVDRDVVGRTVELQRAARDAGVMVCYCATVFRPGYPEIGSRNKTFGQRKVSGQPAVFDPMAVIHPSVAPAEGEVVVGKHRVKRSIRHGPRCGPSGQRHQHAYNPRLCHQRGGAVDGPVRVRSGLRPVRC